MIPHKTSNFQLGTISGGAMGMELFADLCMLDKISKTDKIIRLMFHKCMFTMHL
jgi:hypothetical protein